MKKSTLHILDNIGFSLSTLCAIHCLIFPFLLILLPLVGMAFFLNATAEKVFVVGSVLLAALSLYYGFRHHKSWKPFALYLVSATFLLTATFFMEHSHAHSDNHLVANAQAEAHKNHDHDHEEPSKENRPQGHPLTLAIVVLGGIGIAFSHYFNRRLYRTCTDHKH
jgi:hypothetical protein